MINRWVGITTAAVMLLANGTLVFKDLVPTWLAGDPPPNDLQLLDPGEKRYVQVGIYDERNLCVGTSWTVSHVSGTLLTVHSWTLLRPLRLAGETRTPQIRVHTVLTYQLTSGLDTLRIDVSGLPAPLTFSGEFVPPDDFPCKWGFGGQAGSFVLTAEATRALGDVIRPFDRLPGLYVGQTWRLRLFDPLEQLMPSWGGVDLSGQSVIVRVTGTETIEHAAKSVETFRVETRGVVAWADADGRVLRQIVEVPLLGKLRLEDEEFIEEDFRAVMNMATE